MQTSFTTNTRGIVDCFAQEEFRNVATTTTTTHLIRQQQQLTPTNEFSTDINTTKKVTGKPPQPAVKTYFAKLSYGKSVTNNQINKKHQKKDLNSENILEKEKEQELKLNVMESSRSSQLLEDFAKKKQEREQEIMEIQEMLNKIKSPQKSSERSRPDTSREEDIELKDEEIVKEDVKDHENKKPEKKSVFRRSNSEINLKKPKENAAESTNPRITRRDTQRTSTTNGSLNKPRSKSSQLPLSATECQGNHKKSYNPEEARRYMEMQRKQRKFGNFGNEAALKSKIEKEEIKKRLEELKKNTRKLVSKNIQKKEKIINKNLQKSPIVNKNLNKNKVKENIEKTEKLKENSCKEITNNLDTTEAKKSNTEHSNNNSNMPEISQRSSQSINNILKPSGFALQETNKRIGLLRKAENDKDFSFSSHRNFNFDKENQNLEELTKQLICPKENKQNKEVNMKENNEEFSKEDKKEQAVQTSLKDLKKPEDIIDLEVPATNFNANKKEESLKDHLEGKDSQDKDSNKPHDLPYWLRPSAAQVYPYNFIMAVRRKLEAIAEPMATNNKQKNQETSTTGLDMKTKHKKRKSLELLEDKRTKKLKKKQEENVVEQSLRELQCMKENSNIKQLKPLPQTVDINKSLEKSLAIEKQQKEKPKNRLQEKPDVPIEPLTQFKYLQKSLETKEDKNFSKNKSFYQTPDIPPFRPSALRKSLQSLSSEPEENKQPSHLTSNHKSIESINSEINTNLSSISLQLPISNTLTEVSSLKTESRRTFNHSSKPPQTEDDFTSLSSQVYSSPEKKCKKSQEEFDFLKPRPISPLIFSSPEKKSQKAAKDFEFVKPRPVSPLSLDKVQKLKIKRKEVQLEEEKEDKEMDFSQLLEDFNRSLSQVIQVNEQLKCTLDKSQQILSPHSSKKSTETDKHYSSDFEKSSTKLASSLESDKKLKDSLHRNNENLKQRKRQLFEMAEKVKPLLTPQKRKEDNTNEKPLPELNLDLKSLSDTPETSETEKPTETEIEDEEEVQSTSSIQDKHSYEKRLNEIEKLKETLKQTILESKEKRKERQMLKEREREEYKGNEIQATTLSYRKEIYKETKEQTDSIKDSQRPKQRGREEYKGNDILTANSSYRKQNYKESKEQTDSSKTRTQNEQQSHTESEIPSEIETESEMAKNSTRNSTKFSDSNKTLYKDYKTYEKYEKQYKNSLRESSNGNSKISPYESKTESNKSQKETPTDSTRKERLETGSSTTKSYSLHSKEAVTDLTKDKLNNYKTSKEYSISNYTKSSNKTSSNHAQHSLQQKTYETSETETYSGTQSEMESLKSKSITKTTKNPTASITSSIAEELQNTYETASQDNENIPLTKSKKLPKNISFKQESSKQFIKSHINRSRGDFPETLSKEAHLNETQFQQAIEAASQISSSEFVQSADDEITSSVASKSYHKKSISNPPSYNAVAGGRLVTKTISSPSKTQRRISIGSEIVKFFTEYDCERAERRMTINDSMSESSLNYSNVGLYDKLIQNETNKSQHLTALLKMREKALLDRTKGQIAWLEVQKARYKAKGLINHIAAIKKKQRGILLKMEKEREEIKRLLQTTTANSKVTVEADNSQTTSGHKINSQHNTPTKPKKEKLLSNVPTLTKPKINSGPPLVKPENAISSKPILKATYELESSQALEELLKKREEDLRKRREHVERLMQWHQRLDEEEAEVLNLERQLLNYNNVPHMVEQLQQPKLQTTTYSASTEKLTSAKDATSPKLHEQEVIEKTIKSPEKKRASRARKMEKRLKEIDKSLRELSHISASSTTSVVMGQTNNEREDSVSSVATQEVDYVRTTGLKLNKLWKRLTSQQIEKFEPTRRYKLCKSDLERLYEEAKMAVLRDFAEDEERIAQELLEKSNSNLSSTASPTPQQNLPATASESHSLEVPALNLNFSSGHSEPEEESANNSQANVTQQGNYSPSVAEQNFKAHALLNSSASSETTSEKQTPRDIKQTSRLENNVQMFLALSQRIQATTGKRMGGGGRGGLQRSLSDTEISDVPKFKADKTTTSQKNIANVASQSNSSITTNSSARSYDGSGQHQQHQRSKSSIVEMTNIPSTQTETITNHTDLKQTTTLSSSTLHTDKQQDKESKLSTKDLEDVKKSSNNSLSKRSSVICSVGTVTPIKSSSQQTSSNIATITEDSNSSETLKTKSITKDSISSKIPSATISKQKSTYSAQFSSDSSSKAKEISSKLEEISAAVTQLSQMNALPSYESVTQSHARNKSIEEPLVTATNDESNLSTDASSYSFNFDHITTDKHSSPGTSSSSFHSNSLQNKTLTSKTFTKDLDQQQQQTLSPLYTNSITSNSSNSIKSKTFVKDDNTLTPSALDNHIPETYEADFESDLSNVTHIEDITIPTFETTNETIQEDEDAEEEVTTKSPSKIEDISNDQSKENLSCEASDKTYNAEELKNKTYNAEDVRNSPSANNEKSLIAISPRNQKSSPDRELLPPPPLPPPPPPPSTSGSNATATTTTQNGNGNQLMPDIINELELRRHQLILDNEQLKQYEHVTAVPYMYVREIPNKPPPPYVPPAHGSPMTTIFPSEDRIKDITYRRTHELYCELLKTDYCNEKGEKLPSVNDEQITNIYERIILDICREYLEEHAEILRDGDPTNFHSQLAFFNPPNRLRCIQDAIYKEVRSCLAMDKVQPKRTQIYSVYGQRAKQDHIGKIIIQEMYDEDDRWCNFHREESEVLHLMVEEMINKNIATIAREVLVEEGGTIEEEEEVAVDQSLAAEETTIADENEANHQAEECLEEEGKDQEEQSQLLQTSSVLVETLNEDDKTYCVNETKQDYTTVLSQTTPRIDTSPTENVNNSNGINSLNTTTTTPNAVQTCT